MPRLSVATVESAANTFTDGSQVTGLEGQTNRGYRILEASWEFDAALVVASGDEINFALCRQAKTAMPLVTDVDVLYKFSQFMISAAAYVSTNIVEWKPTREIIIVEDPIHLVVQGTSLASALTISGEIFYEVVSISEIDRLTLLTQSLSGA